MMGLLDWCHCICCRNAQLEVLADGNNFREGMTVYIPLMNGDGFDCIVKEVHATGFDGEYVFYEGGRGETKMPVLNCYSSRQSAIQSLRDYLIEKKSKAEKMLE
jgi:hypothetical protein